MSVNKVIVLGNVGKLPKFHTFENGSKVAALSLATSEKWLDKNKQWQEETQWHRLVVSGFNVQKLEKVQVGSTVYAEGALKYRKYVDKNNIERVVVEIDVTSLEVISGQAKPQSQKAVVAQPEQQPQVQAPPAPVTMTVQQTLPVIEDDDDIVPF